MSQRVCALGVAFVFFMSGLAYGVGPAQAGKLDHTFGDHGVILEVINDAYDNVAGMAIFPAGSANAGKMVVVGDTDGASSTSYETEVVVYNPDGTLYTDFNGTGKKTIDLGGSTDFCKAVAIDPDDKIVVLVDHRSGGNSYLCLIRLNLDGTLDTTFSGDGIYQEAGTGYFRCVTVQKDGKILVGGATAANNCCVGRIASNGGSSEYFTTDMTAFVGGAGLYENIYNIALDDAASGSQSFYATGNVQYENSGKYKAFVAKFDSAGSASWRRAWEFVNGTGASCEDIEFHDFGGGTGEKLVVGGGSSGTSHSDFDSFAVAVLNLEDGSYFTGFNTTGYQTIDINSNADWISVGVQSNNKIIIGGDSDNGYSFARYNENGTLDVTWNSTGQMTFDIAGFDWPPYPHEFCIDNQDMLVACFRQDTNSAGGRYGLARFHTSNTTAEYVRTELSQVSENHSLNQEDAILQIKVCMDGTITPLHATSFTFNTTGSTDAATDIASARLYTTGSSSTFSTSQPAGSAVTGPDGEFTISDLDITLGHGDNYFWLTYTLTGSPTTDDTVDAQCTALTVGGQSHAPTNMAPAGAWTIAAPAYGSIWGDNTTDTITNVSFCEIDNTSGLDGSGYGDYTAQVANVDIYQVYTLSCTNTGDWPNYPSTVLAWIDWNQDYQFSDPAEIYLVAQEVTASGPHTIDILVPEDAAPGNTRMRVITLWDQGSYPSEGDLLYGEAEDYTVHVTSQLTPTVNEWPTASAITYGESLSDSTLSGGNASVAGTFAFDAPATTPDAGTYSAAVTFTPTDAVTYATVSGSVNVTVNKATPTVSEWPTATTITYGDTLADSTLSGGTASVAGSFDYDSPTTAPNTGTNSQDVTFTPTDTDNYETVSGSVNVTVNKATPTVNTWPTAGAITYGDTLSDSTLSGGSASVAGSFDFDNPSTAPNAGTYSVAVTFTPSDTDNYVTVTEAVDVTVNKATPTVSAWPTATAITYGDTLADSTLSGGSASAAGSFDFDSPATTPDAGTDSHAVTFTPNDTNNYQTVSGSVNVTVDKATPTVTEWPTATAITYGDTLADSTLSGGSASVAGSFDFDSPGMTPGAGMESQPVTFTPADADNYETVAGNVDVTVNKATPTVTEWPTASAITYGDTLADSTLNGGAASVTGSFDFDSPATAPDAGTDSQGVTFIPNDSDNYETVSGSVNVTVNKATPTVTEWPVASEITYGQTLSNSLLSGGAASVDGMFDFDNPGAAPDAGTASHAVTFTPNDADNYEAVSGSVDVTVNKATPTVTGWPTASAITYGDTLADSTLTGGEASVDGIFAFDSPALAPDAGTESQSVTFTPTDTNNYEVVAGSVSVTVNKATPTVDTWPTATAITYGDTLAESTLNGGSASVAGSFAFDSPATAPDAGADSHAVTFTPTDTDNYETVAGSVDVTVNKATPTVTAWPTATAITYGDTLADSTLNGGTASVAGSFAFDNPTTAPDAGTNSQAVTFTPADTDNYETVAGTVNVTVNKAAPTVSAWPTATAISYGQTLAHSTLNGGTALVEGTFAFTSPTTAPTAGSYDADVTFTPTDTDNYQVVSGTVSVTVNKATPTVSTWPTASALIYGQTLASSILTGGSGSVAGTFEFTAPTTAPTAGTYSAAVTFSPTDSANYNAVSGTVNVTVNKATPTITAWPTATAITTAQSLADSTLSGGSASVGGAFAFTNPAAAPGVAGPYEAAVTFAPSDPANYNTVAGTIMVNVNNPAKKTPAVTWPTASAIVKGHALSTSILSGGSAADPVTSATVAGTFVFDAPASEFEEGTYTVDVIFTPTNTTTYNVVAGSVTVVVGPNTPPEFNTVSNKIVEEGQTVQFSAAATDVDGDPLTYSATGLPDGANYDSSTGAFSWTPPLGSANSYPITFTVEDQFGSDSVSLEIEVRGQPATDAPNTDIRPPVILAGPLALEITQEDALITWQTDELATGTVTIWTEPPVVFQEQEDLDDPLFTTHQVIVSGLAAGTQYQYSVSSSDAQDNGPTESARQSFRTLAATVVLPPVFTKGPEVAYTSDTVACLDWATDKHVALTVEYGIAAQPPVFGTTVSVNDFAQQGTVILGELTPATAYNVRVTATDRSGGGVVVSPVLTFTTDADPDSEPPVIVYGPEVAYVTQDQAIVYWVTNKPTTGQLHYGTGGKALSGSVANSGYGLEHTIVLTNLQPATQYELTCVATDPVGNEATGDSLVETPAIGTTIPVPAFTTPVAVSDISSTTARLAWGTDLPTDAYAVISDGETSWTIGELRITNTHELLLTGLTTNKTYTVVVYLQSPFGDTVESDPVLFSTENTDSPDFVSDPWLVVNPDGMSATLHWEANKPVLVQVDFWLYEHNPISAMHATTDALDIEGTLQLQPLQRGSTYIYRIRLTDARGHTRLRDAGAFTVPVDGPCFIATAAYGTSLAPQIDVLRKFRDSYLLTNSVGTWLVDTYYRLSPSVASTISAHPTLAGAVRLVLSPVVALVRAFVAGPWLFAGLLLAVMALTAAYRRRIYSCS